VFGHGGRVLLSTTDVWLADTPCFCNDVAQILGIITGAYHSVFAAPPVPWNDESGWSFWGANESNIQKEKLISLQLLDNLPAPSINVCIRSFTVNAVNSWHFPTRFGFLWQHSCTTVVNLWQRHSKMRSLGLKSPHDFNKDWLISHYSLCCCAYPSKRRPRFTDPPDLANGKA